MKTFWHLLFLHFAVISLLCGCTPEETFVSVNASSLRKATAGELAFAKVEMVFDIQDKDDTQLPSKIRKVALPYLGEGAIIEVERTEKRKVRESGSIREDNEVEVSKSLDGAKLVARFNIPVGIRDVLEKTRRSILWLEYTPSDKTFRLVGGNAIRSLNSALSDVNDNIEFEYEGGTSSGFDDGTTIKIVNDEHIAIGIAAVNVNGKSIISGTCNTEDGAIKISFNNNFYKGVSPCFTWGGFQTMRPVKLTKTNSWFED